MMKKDLFWMTNPDWWEYNEYGDEILRDDAPEEAKKSYKIYLKQLDEDDNI